MDLSNYLTEIYFRKRTKPERRKIKRARIKSRRGTDFKSVKPKEGYKRVKDASGRHYTHVRLKSNERISKKKVGKALGKQARRLKK